MQKQNGTVVGFDPISGKVDVKLRGQEHAMCLHIGALYGGRGFQYPVNGDKVTVQLSDSPSGKVIVMARLVLANSQAVNQAH